LFFKGKNYPATAETIGLSEVVGWDRKTMLEMMIAYPEKCNYEKKNDHEKHSLAGCC
jgi:hypothetical protein